MLMATAYRYTRSQFSANDVLQESFIIIYKQISKLKVREEAVLVSWMRKITAREALRWVKKNKIDDHGDIPERSRDETKESDQREDIDYIMNMLQPEHKIVIQLHSVEGFSHREIGEMLGIEESSSRARLSRARKVFTDLWSKHLSYENG